MYTVTHHRPFTQTNGNLSTITDEIHALNKQIEHEMSVKAQYSKILSEVGNINQECVDKAHQIEKERVRLETIKSSLKEDMTAKSLSELENQLAVFDSSAGRILSELEERRDYADEIKNAITALQKREHELIQAKGVLIGEKRNHENDLKRRVEIITQILNNYEINYDQSQVSHKEGSLIDVGTQRSLVSQGSVATSGRLSLTMLSQESTIVIPEEELAGFQRLIREKHDELANDLANLKRRHQSEDDEYQKVIGEFMTKVRSMDTGMFKIA